MVRERIHEVKVAVYQGVGVDAARRFPLLFVV